MTTPDFTEDEAAELADKLGAVLVEERGAFVLYKVVTVKGAKQPPSEEVVTMPMRKVEIARGATRREALDKATALLS